MNVTTIIDLIRRIRETHDNCIDYYQNGGEPKYLRDGRCDLCKEMDQMLMKPNNPTYTPTIDEGERQMIIMALAHLAVERPGWQWTLEQIAYKIDEKVYDQHKKYPKIFNQLRRIHKHESPIEPQPTRRVKIRRESL